MSNYYTLLSKGSDSIKIYKIRDTGQVIKCVRHSHKKPETHMPDCKELQEEYELVTSLNHPNIIQFHNYTKNMVLMKSKVCAIEMEQAVDNFLEFFVNKTQTI